MNLAALLAWHYFVRIKEELDVVRQREKGSWNLGKLPDSLEIAGFSVLGDTHRCLVICYMALDPTLKYMPYC